MQYSLGSASVIEYVARHFAKRAPSPRYSASRSRSPSRPSVMVSPSASASGFAPVSTLIPGMIPFDCEQLRERRPVGGALADRLVEEDDAADVLLGARRREEQVAVGAPVLLGRLDADRVEALLDRAVALVGGEDPLPLGDERARRSRAVRCWHRRISLSRFVCRIIPWRDLPGRAYNRRRTADVAQLVEHCFPSQGRGFESHRPLRICALGNHGHLGARQPRLQASTPRENHAVPVRDRGATTRTSD